MGKTFKKQMFILVGLFLGLTILFQNCSEIKPLSSEGAIYEESGAGDDNNGDSGDGGGSGGDNGDQGAGDGGDNNVVGSYDNSDPYKCDYNDDGVVDFVTRANGVSYSSRPSGFEYIQPQGFTMYNKTWSSQFNGREWGAQISYLAPIGSFSVGDASAAGMYITIPFRPDENVPYRLEWYEAQAVRFAEYWYPRSAESLLVSVSPCAGDIRPQSRTSTDPWIKACKRQSSQSILSFSTDPRSACKLKPGKTYWLTIIMADGSDGVITPNENACSVGRTECEANFDLNF